MGNYDTALVCLEGHIVNGALQRHPEDNSRFCPRCGSETICACPACRSNIRGSYYGDIFIAMSTRPACCPACGAAYPWTERHIQAALDLFADEVSDAAEMQRLKEDLQTATKDVSATPSASKRVRQALAKVAPATAKLIEGVVSSVVSETAKKILFPR